MISFCLHCPISIVPLPPLFLCPHSPLSSSSLSLISLSFFHCPPFFCPSPLFFSIVYCSHNIFPLSLHCPIVPFHCPIVSCAVTTPAYHPTFPLASTSLLIFFSCALAPFLHLSVYSLSFSICYSASTPVPTFFPCFCLLHRFCFGTCFPHFSTLPTLYFIIIESSAHFC